MSDNVYDDHPLMINSGQFWRCKHENTGLDNNANWIGCLACAEEKIDALRTHLAEKDAEIEAMRKQIEGVNVTAAFQGIPITVNKYLPKRTIIVSSDFIGEEQEKFFPFPITIEPKERQNGRDTAIRNAG